MPAAAEEEIVELRPSLLVVDDEEPLLEIFCEFFEESQYRLTIAKTGEEAIEFLKNQPFDLVVTDLNLPGVDGLTVMTHAKSVDPEMEVIVLTGNASTLTAIDALRQGAYDYMLKPFDLYEMEQTVHKALERRILLSQNRQYVGRLQRHRDELEARVEEATWRARTLYEVGKEITASLDLERTLNLILEKSIELTRAEQGMLFLLDENSGDLDCDVSLGIAEGEDRDIWTRSLRQANDRAVVMKSAVLETIDGPATSGSTGARPVAVVPILQENRVMGTICILAGEGGAFSEDSQELMVGLASQASISIHNARVYEKIQSLDRMKSEFVAVVSHEVRTPLTAIKGTLEILGDTSYFEIPDSQLELLEICQTNVERLETLINDILDFSKLESSRLSTHFGPVTLDRVAESVIVNLGNLAEKQSVHLVSEVSSDLPTVEADELRISQVIGNLISNAIKFSDENGTIRVLAKEEDAGVTVTIADAGIGISPEDQAKLFMRFQQVDSSSTRKAGGTGLGLAISKGIIDEHLGRIWVDSDVGEGSRFSFWLPCARSRGELPEAGSGSPDAGSSATTSTGNPEGAATAGEPVSGSSEGSSTEATS